MKFVERLFLLILLVAFFYLLVFWLFNSFVHDLSSIPGWNLLPKLTRVDDEPSVKSVEKPRSRIFCIVLTQPNNSATRMPAVFKFWASKCDNHRFISVIPDQMNRSSVPAGLEVDTGHGVILQPRGLIHEQYRKLTDKVYSAFREIYKRFDDDYDWYLKADDDTMIFMDNLRDFLADKNASEAISFGYNFLAHVQGGYQSGGAGYLMSREAFRRLGIILNEDAEYCTKTGFEDIDVGKCLRSLGTTLGNSTDELGRERFHPLSPANYARQRFPKWLQQSAQNRIPPGMECCSDSSISYHYVRKKELEAIDSLIQMRIRANISHASRLTFGDILRCLNLKMDAELKEPRFY